MARRSMVPNHQSGLVAPDVPHPPTPPSGATFAFTLRNAPAMKVLAFVAIAGGLIATAVWITLLGFALFKAVELLL
jgi:hypothetical protein